MMKRHNLKRAVGFILTMLLLLSSAVFAAAEAAVTAAADGVPLTSGESIPAVSTLVFTLPNSITTEELATAVTFEEIQKGRAAPAEGEAWDARLYKGVLSGNTLTVTFSEGDLAMHSEYRFTFNPPAVTGDAQTFIFNTTRIGNYYVNENFSRYPAGASVTSGQGNTMLEAPWWNGRNRYGRVGNYLVDDNGKTILRLKSSSVTVGDGVYGVASYDNSYAPVYTGTGTKHMSVTEATFSVVGNPSSIFEVGGVIIRTDSATGKTGLYVRTGDIVQATQGDAGIAKTQALNFDVAAPTDQKVQHTVKFIMTSNHTNPHLNKIFNKIWFDGVEVPLPAGGITVSWHSLMGEDSVNYSGATGLSHIFAASNCYGGTESGVAAYTEMDVYSYKYATLAGVEEIVTDSDPLVGVHDAVTVKFGDTPLAAAGTTVTDELAGQITLTKVGGSTVPWQTDGYDPVTNSITIKPSVPLEHNAQYTVTVPARAYALVGTGEAVSKTFTTGWEKLEVSTAATEAAAEGFAPTVTVKNISSAAVSYITRLVLYREENGIVQQVAVHEKTDHAPLAAGDTAAAVSVGSVSDPKPSETASYFARIFFLEGENAASEKLVIGTEPVYAGGIDGGTSSAVSFEPAPDPDAGRIDVQGQYVGGLAGSRRALWITVTDPDGAVVYYDQLSSGKSGRFALGFNLVQGSAENGAYTVTVKPSDTPAFSGSVALNFDSVKPSITKLEVTGTAVYGETLTAAYSLFDFVERPDASVVSWQTADTENGTYTEVATGTTYTIPRDMVGKYLKCVVTPKVTVAGGTSDGGAYSTDTAGIAPIYLASVPEAENVVLSQTAGSNTITLTYQSSDPLNHTQGVRLLTWRIKNPDGTDAKVIDNSASDIYVLTAEDNGKLIQAEVTPAIKLKTCGEADACKDIEYGEKAYSNVLTMAYTAVAAGTTTSGGGGGGGGSSFGGGMVAGSGNPKQSAPVYQGPEDGESSAGAIDLPDVRGHWAEEEIFELYDQSIVTGRSEQEFDPNGQITRGEFVAILVRAMVLEPVSYNGSFADVTAGQWYADILEAAYQNGLFMGSDGYAYPDRAISREEMVQIIVRAYEKACGEIVVGGGLLDYTDAAQISTWAREAVIKATEIVLVQGTGDGLFTPKANATRAEGAVIISRFMKHLPAAASGQTQTEQV